MKKEENTLNADSNRDSSRARDGAGCRWQPLSADRVGRREDRTFEHGCARIYKKRISHRDILFYV